MKTPEPKPYDTTTANYALLNAHQIHQQKAMDPKPKRIKVVKPKPATAAAIGLLLLMAIAVVGCAQTRTGILREQAVYQSGTNTLHFVTADIAPLIPSPYSGVVTAATGIIGALLAAWNLSQQKRLAALESANPTDKTATGAVIPNKPS